MKSREKQLNENRISRDETVAVLASLRERVDDPAIKGRLRAIEDKLAVCPPTVSDGAAATDAEIRSLASDFMRIYRQGVLTERYLVRLEALTTRRVGYM